MVLGFGSSIMALNDPWRADMVAVSGEVTGKNALECVSHIAFLNSNILILLLYDI